MGEENTDIPTVALEVITNNLERKIDKNFRDWEFHRHPIENELIRRKDVIEMLEEDGELYEIILERFKEAEDVDDTIWYNKFGTLFDVIIQDLKQKLKSEAREE